MSCIPTKKVKEREKEREREIREAGVKGRRDEDRDRTTDRAR